MSIPKKRIIICCDGTYDDFADTIERVQPGSHVSRLVRWLVPPWVYHVLWGLRLFKLIKRVESAILGPKTLKPFRSNVSQIASAIKPQAADGMQQMVLYVGGIGALGTPQSRFEEAVTGNTMSYKIRYVYRAIVDNYVAGDEIFLFGYSRGAFTAQAVVGLIEWAGLLRKANMDLFDSIWTEYRTTSPDPEGVPRSRPAWLDNLVHTDAKVRCVGIFDTVGSLKAPPIFFNSTDDTEIARKASERYDGFNICLGEHVENVFQALALDERRFDFYPAVLAKRTFKGQVLKQSWFPGVHADMGGRSTTLLALFPLVWMISKSREVSLLEFDDDYVRSKILDPLFKAYPKHDWDHATFNIRPSHWIDRNAFLRRLIPLSFLPLTRYVHRNPNMAANSKPLHPGSIALQMSMDVDPYDEALVEEQKFHWTVLDRMKYSTNYWDVPIPPPSRSEQCASTTDLPVDSPQLHSNNLQPCVALRRRNPMRPSVEIEKEHIEKRRDLPVGIDKVVYDYFLEQRNNRDVC